MTEEELEDIFIILEIMDKKLEKLNAYKKLETEIVYTLTWIELTGLEMKIKTK